jgi:hypothetical protein
MDIPLPRISSRRHALWIIVVAALVAGYADLAGQLFAAQAPAVKTVELTIDYGDGVQLRFTALPWREKMTVLDAVTTVSNHPHGVKCQWRGSGANAFVTQIGDLKNEGGGKTSRNWLFVVGGKESEVGMGDYTLKPGDVVLWRFGVTDNNGG